MKNISLGLVRASIALVGLSLILTTANASPELVTNGDFETPGYLPGWTVSMPALSSPTVVPTDVHSGTSAAQFASFGQPFAILSQVLTTTPGTTYNISFWEQAGGGGGGNFNPGTQEFKALFNGVTLLDQQVTNGVVYTNYTYQAVATSSTTTLEFDSRNDPSWNYLDDVSVTGVVPEPSSLVLAVVSLASLAVLRRTRHR